MVIILHNATTQQPDSCFPDSGGSVLHVIQQLPRLAAFQVPIYTIGEVEGLFPPKWIKDDYNSDDGKDDDNPAVKQKQDKKTVKPDTSDKYERKLNYRS